MAKFEIDGIQLDVPDDILVPNIRAKLEAGRYEGSEARAARTSVKQGDRVLEFGAGLGYIACICARLCGPENVVTIEASPAMIDVIRGNLDQNGYEKATLLQGAVTGEPYGPDLISFTQAPAFWASSLTKDGQRGDLVDVPVLRLDDLLEQYQPTVVIMDIEGAEQTMFDAPWPAYIRVVLVELHPKVYGADVIKRIVDCMSESGLTYAPFLSRGAMIGFQRVKT